MVSGSTSGRAKGSADIFSNRSTRTSNRYASMAGYIAGIRLPCDACEALSVWHPLRGGSGRDQSLAGAGLQEKSSIGAN
jgi:hypothetical protein